MSDQRQQLSQGDGVLGPPSNVPSEQTSRLIVSEIERKSRSVFVMLTRASRAATVFVSLLVALASPGLAEAGESLHRLGERIVFPDVKAGAFKRSYVLYVPPSVAADPARPAPLVVALHGGLATARIFARQSGLHQLARDHGFVVASPNGLGIFSLLRHWNGGWCCAKAMRSGLDDVGFIDRVIDDAGQRVAVDPQRLYVVGYSNGGMMAYRYATERAERVTALGIWASSIGSRNDERVRWSLPFRDVAVPAIIAHGLSDARLPFEPVAESDAPRRRQGADLLGAIGSATYWAEANGCADGPEPLEVDYGRLWRFCPEDAERRVELIAVDDWGHDWPGPRTTAKLSPSDPRSGFDLATQMWEFFRAAAGGEPGSS